MSSTQSVPKAKSPNRLQIFFRLTRIQFIPLIILPALAGTAFAWLEFRRFDPLFFSLVLLGVVLLHLGANAVDDVYDFESGVDRIANSMFPPDFGGWKPLPRGLVSLKAAKAVSAGLFLFSIAIGAYFWSRVGIWSIIFALTGVALAIFYTAPPLKLDYRGKALGELSILLSFGPIPVLGAFYVQTGILSVDALLVSIPIGVMTVTILIDHDLIFYEVYSKSGKLSLGTVLGRGNALKLSLFLTGLSYVLVAGLAIVGLLPLWSLLAPVASALILARKANYFLRAAEGPPFYVPFTVNGLFANWCFSLVLALTMLL